MVCGRAQLLPIFLAALVNSLGYYEHIALKEFLTASSIALGATIQAYVAVLLVQRALKDFKVFESFSETSYFLLLAGPLACVINATLATLTLIFVDVLSAEQFFQHAGTWWLGDILGVVLFAPVTVLLMSKRTEHSYLTAKRKGLVAVPLLLSFALFVLLFCYVLDVFKDRSFREFEAEAEKTTRLFRQEISVDITSVVALSSFVSSSEYVSAEEFRSFTRPLLKYTQGVYGFSWIPKVEHDTREDFVQSIREQGYAEFEILERNEKGALDEAADSDVYFPLAYTEPYELNKSAHGLNVYGHDGVAGDLRKQILDKARNLREPQGTARFAIVQRDNDYGFIIYQPVFKGDGDAADHIGYVNGIFLFSQLMHGAYERAKQISADIVVLDKTQSEPMLLYDSRAPDFKEHPSESYDFIGDATVYEHVEVAGRDWQIIYLRTSSDIDQKYLQEIWAFALGGIVFNILLSLILIIVTARNDFIESLVKVKTRELEEANAELEEFTYRTSHDLRSPLVSSKGIAEVIRSAVNEGDGQKAKQGSDLLITSLEKLLVLIDDLMSLAETKNRDERAQEINLRALIEDSLAKFSHMENYDRLDITTDIGVEAPVKSKLSRVRLILENLISNSIKYQDTAEDSSYIKIDVKRDKHEIVIRLEDNGLGVPERNRDKLFGMFNRFHTKVSYGSGLGLYMVKKSAEIIGGSVEYRGLEKGSAFILKFPEL